MRCTNPPNPPLLTQDVYTCKQTQTNAVMVFVLGLGPEGQLNNVTGQPR